MKILVVDDGTLTAKVLKDYLKEQLSDFEVELSFVILRKNYKSFSLVGQASSLSDSETSGIQDFYGSAKELEPQIREANVLVVHKAPVSCEVIEAIAGLQLIACARGGPSNVDLEAATKMAIPVVYAPGRSAKAAADLTIGLILMLARNLIQANHKVRNFGPRAWNYSVRSGLEGIELYGKNIGIVGFGQVGREVASRVRAFGMNILVHSSHAAQEEIADYGAKSFSLEELLIESDFVTIHSRLTPKNKGIIGMRELNLMKKTAFLINTARGGLIDEQALYEVLKKGRIKGAALDVLTKEPPGRNNPLLKLKNVIITPHLGGKTKEVPLRAAQMIGDEIKRFLRGEELQNVANPQLYKN